MTWLETIPTIFVAGLIIFVPGALLGRCLGARGLTWAATSAPLTVSLVSLGAILAQKLHVDFSIYVVVAVTVLTCLLTLAIRVPILARRRKDSPEGTVWVRPERTLVLAVIAGMGAAALILFIRFIKIFIAPENISQTYDNVFHLNAIRFILNTGNGSSLSIASLGESSTSNFYPAAWHDVVALVVGTMGVPIPVGVNAVNIILGTFVWTISCMFLASRVLGTRPATFLVTGALVAGFNAFPYLLLEFGVLYPNFLAITLLPVLMALVADLLKLSREPSRAPWLTVVLLAASAPGLALAHPNALLALGVFVLSPLLAWLVVQTYKTMKRQITVKLLVGSVALVAVYVLVLSQVWGVARPSKKASDWPPFQTVPQAIGEALTNAPIGRVLPWLVALLTAAGIYAVFRHRKGYWLLGAFAISSFLFVVVSAFEKNDLRDFFTGVWYNDSYRLAAMLPIFALPLAAMGAVSLLDLAKTSKPITLLQARGNHNLTHIVGAISWVALLVLVQGFSIASATGKARDNYVMNADSALLTVDEHTLLMRLDQHVPADGIILNNPGTGANLAYALADRQVVLPAAGSLADADESLVFRYLPALKTDPAVCKTVTRIGALYLLDFGAQEINKMSHLFPTSQELANLEGVELIDQQGEAKLYRITACG